MVRAILRTRFISLSLVSVLVLLGMVDNDVSARGLGKIEPTTATVAAEIINCRLEEGWCSRGPYVLITGDDPAYSILSINGSTNGMAFQCGGKTCSIPLNVGSNNLVFWSVSSSGRDSEKKYLTINLTTSPTHSLINIDLTKKAEASVLSGKQLQVDADNELKDPRSINLTGSSSIAESPAVQTKASDPKDFLEINAIITNCFLQRNCNSQKNKSSFQNMGEEYNLVLDILPPILNILPQQSISGTFTFEGNAFDDVSGIKSLMINMGQGWLPVQLENNHWIYQWNTEKAGISGDVFDFQVQVEDTAGNQQIQTRRFTVLNRIWPVLALCGLLLSLGITAALDPRRKAWRELAQITARAIRVNAMDSPKEKR